MVLRYHETCRFSLSLTTDHLWKHNLLERGFGVCRIELHVWCQKERSLASRIHRIQDQAFDCTYVQGFQICTQTQYCPCRPREQRPRAPQRVGLGLGLGLGSGLGSGWSGQRNRRFVRTYTEGATIHKSLLNLRANLENLARTCNFAGAAE